jgi:cytochrome c553
MKFKMKHILPLAAIMLLIVGGCYNDKADKLYPEPTVITPGGNTCDTTSMSFATNIKPITDQYCATASCHSAGVAAGTYDFTTAAGLKQAVTNGKLLGAINQQTGFSAMPQGMAKLSDCNINKITAWVNQGALDN